MILIVGLGNPGEKFEKTRHNLGFRVIDEFLVKNNFPDFRLSKKFNSKVSEDLAEGEKVILVKPQIFMNNSGKAVKSITKAYKLKTINLIVVHDDIDLPLGKIRIIKNRGAAGHKGVQSIIDELGTKNFIRLRVGIQSEEKPSTRAKLGTGLVPHRNKVSGAGFVLQKFNKEEEKILKGAIEKAVEAIEFFLKEGLEKTMSEFNK
jgi:PTH1 family peptidyl-tRNA hydrolase